MSIEKKCPHCNQWTSWNQKLNDRCGHCNELLDAQRVKETEEFLAREKTYKRSDWFTIKEDDNIFMRATRRVALFFHIVFGAISWFFIWSFVNAAG